MTAERSANDVWLQDSNVFCACARRSIACSSVRSSNVATIWLSYGLTVWYAMMSPPSVPADRPPIWTSSFLHEISVFTTDHAQFIALSRSIASIRISQGHVVGATAKLTYRPARILRAADVHWKIVRTDCHTEYLATEPGCGRVSVHSSAKLRRRVPTQWT